MQPVTVGRFGDDVVGIRKRHGVRQDALVVTPHVACIAQRAVFSTLFESDVYGTATQHVAAVDELDGHLRGDIEMQSAWNADKGPHALHGILFVVDWFDRRFTHTLRLLVELPRIGLLDATRIGQHDGAEVAGGRRAEHLAAES